MNEVFLLQYMHYLCVFEVQNGTVVKEILIFLLLRLRKLMNNELLFSKPMGINHDVLFLREQFF